MTDLAIRSGQTLLAFWAGRIAPNSRKFLLLMLLALLLASSSEMAGVVMQAMSDAYLAVTVFVAATLALFYSAERLLKIDLGEVMASATGWQPAIAAFLGALPGCGGAIIVVTQYTRGYASFGAFVSVLVATMGDAAFLLIAREPMTGLLVMAVGMAAGTISGMVIDRLHGRDFLRPKAADPTIVAGCDAGSGFIPPWATSLWLAMLVPGLVIGALMAFLVDIDAWTGIDGLTIWFGFAGAAFALILWAFSGNGNSHILHAGATASVGDRVVIDTNFVTAWVVMAFLAYEIGVHILGADVSVLFQAWAPVMPLVGILVGFVPGCGPQIVVTSLYLAGAIPLSAQFANAIANDGDALFPAIALAPRAAFVATLYSALPALIIGYGWFFLFE